MKKAKKEMKEEEERQDNLEITSIGSLYRGPWDKKYWSSSRGKDRYPYPIGYQAVRSQGSKICKMEIHEGVNGPQFLITTGDGQSCSGQTPDIAWGKYQRTGLPCVKSLNEKRLTCKIDGVEFFGFKNPFVQRLLRELVAGVNRTAERESLCSSSFNGAIDIKQDIHCPMSCASSDLLSFLEKPRVRGQRRKKRNVSSIKMSGGANLKSCQPQDLSCIPDVPKIRKQNHKVHYDGKSIKNSDSEKHHHIHSYPGAVPLSSDLEATAPEENRQSATQVLHSGLSSDENPLCRCSMEDNLKEENFFAPDTLDFLHENSSGPPTSSPEESSSILKDDLISGNVGSGEESPINSLPETAGTSVSDAGSQNNDNDSVSEGVAKSMMSLLLPQALPLLKKTYKRKRRRTVSPSEVSLCVLKFQKKNDCLRVEHVSSAAMQIENASGNFDSLGPEGSQHIKSVIPGSFEKALQCNVGEGAPDTAKHSCADSGEACPDSEENTLLMELSVCYVENSNDADALLPTVNMFSKERSQKTDILVAGSAFNSTPSNKEILNGKSMDPHTDFSKKSEQQPPFEESKTALDKSVAKTTSKLDSLLTVQKEINTASGHDEDDNLALALGKFGSPLPEITMSRTFRTDQAPKIFPNTLSNQVSTSNSNPDKEVLISDDSNKLGQSESSNPLLQKQQRRFHDSETSDSLTTPVSKPFIDSASSGNLARFVKLVGLYVHPIPVLSVVLSMKENGIHICTLCGSVDGEDRTLFMYKLDINDAKVGCPSFVGHASVIMPFLDCNFGGENTLENSGLQFSPDGQCLVLLNSIKVPQCREGKIQCRCSECTSNSFEENAVKIVQLKLGFVSVVTKLKADKSINCILVCEPNHLVAVEEGGRLYLWAMNSTWSAMTEEFIMPAYDSFCPSVVELKQMPMCSHLILGHNGIGEFGFWDISRRILVSRFSAPTISVSQIMPISLFSWKRNNPPFPNSSSEQITNSMIGATKMWYSEQTKSSAFILSEEQEIAIWLLISTGPDSDFQYQHQRSRQMSPGGCWRLGLLVKNKLVLGTTLDSSAVAVAALADKGILATCDGLVYMWELSTGTKIGTLHHFKGDSIPLITTDGSKRSGAVAIANGGELLVYLHPMSNLHLPLMEK